MLKEIIIAGAGGQGALAAGEILAIAAMLEGKKVAWIAEYGPAMRGGTANCTVIISDEEIGSTIVDAPPCVIVMNQPSSDRFLPKIQSEGLAIINSSLVSSKPRIPKIQGVTFIEVEASTIAQNIGNLMVANLVMLGAYVAYSGVVSMKRVLEALNEWSKEKGKEDFLKTNRRALRAGARIMRTK